jgi:S-adenosylmethionine:tRNA ribosyltransferase-isomerase
LKHKEIPICEILLHVGYGTFQPIRTEKVESHRMHPEYFRVEAECAQTITGYKEAGRSLISVGTTSTRVLEYLASSGGIREAAGYCDLFIYPGFEFKAVDGLLTNFHLPKSTLFLLVCAFGGRDLMLDCYREAIEKKYRFFSYGDCMLVV